MSVVDDGILKGYVPIDKDWTGFSPEEYRTASESCMGTKAGLAQKAAGTARLDLSGYEIVRAQFFSTIQNPALTISNGKMRFNTACLKKFQDVEYVELLLNSVNRCIAIRPCEKENPNAIHWGKLRESRWYVSQVSCRGLARTLFDIMNWEDGVKYRFRGEFIQNGEDKLMLFQLDEPEMIKVEEIVLPPQEADKPEENADVTEVVIKKRMLVFPEEWENSFGRPASSLSGIQMLTQEHYAKEWDVLRPARELDGDDVFTVEKLQVMMQETEKIMEGWTLNE